VAGLATEPTTTVDRGSLPITMIAEGEVNAETLDAVDRALQRRSDLSTMADAPRLVMGDTQAERLAPTSLAWRTDTTGREALVARSVARTASLQSAVSVPEGSKVNLVSSSGELPIRVVNSLDQDVTVEVRLHPSDGRLVAQKSVLLTVPADGDATATIPVHGIKTADVTAAVEIYTPTGVLIDRSTSLEVRVRAEWENIGTAVVGVLLTIGLAAGLTRTIRRGGARAHAEPR
jgi:hypothetical protein